MVQLEARKLPDIEELEPVLATVTANLEAANILPTNLVDKITLEENEFHIIDTEVIEKAADMKITRNLTITMEKELAIQE